MESKPGFIGIRKAFIDTINDDGTYNIFYADDNSNNILKNVNAVNIGSFGSGIFITYDEGAPVWVGQSYYYQPLIIGFADMPGSIERGNILTATDIDAPRRDPGEVIVQASSGAHLDLRKTGDIKLSSLKNDSMFISEAHRAILSSSYQNYIFTDSGYVVQGRIKRFHPKYMPGNNPVFVDLLVDPEADAFTVEISRDPTQKSIAMNRARGITNVIRNPAFAEKREMILEFADSFFVRDSQIESKLASEFPKTINEMDSSIARRRGYGTDEQTFNDLRHSSRTNVLKLDSNVIIERVEGTLVDIFGNVLDINYNKLNLPKLSDTGRESVQHAHSLLHRSVAYHFQVNSRNVIENGTGSGKFTFDIDKEGQFKINVPRSSVLGTVATISSFIKNETDTRARIDVNNVQLSKSDIDAPTGGKAGTAFHDMTSIAERLIRYTLQTINPIRVHNNTLGINQNGDVPNIEFLINATTELPDAIPENTTTISVKNGDPAITDTILTGAIGGRSGQINMEGSLELSIGKDDVDEKSLMLDTAGSLIAWLGADRHGRSAIVNADGTVLLNIGDYITDDDGNREFKKGTLAIRVNLADDENSDIGELKPGQSANNKKTSDHILYLGPQGIVISSGNSTPLVIRSGGDILFETAGTIDMKAKEIRMDAGYLRRVKPGKGDI